LNIDVVGTGPYSINPSSTKRDWMNNTYNSHAYRCLPLTSANSHGWTINLEEECVVEWDGKEVPGSVKVLSGSGEENVAGGYVTFRLPYIFTTEKEYYLWCSGQPNYIRKDISPMNAIVRTDWYPATFQFTWKVNTPGKIVFEKGMPIMFFMPYPKDLIDNVQINVYNTEKDIKKKTISGLYSEYIDKSSKRIQKSKDPWKEWMGLYRKGKYSEKSKQLVEDPLWVPQPSKPIKN
jgi:hypothetical protein